MSRKYESKKITLEDARNIEKGIDLFTCKEAPDPELLAKYTILDSKIQIKNISDLLQKYSYYKPSYDEKTNIFAFSKHIPIEIYNAFRVDSVIFKFSDFIVYDIQEDYYSKNRWK